MQSCPSCLPHYSLSALFRLPTFFTSGVSNLTPPIPSSVTKQVKTMFISQLHNGLNQQESAQASVSKQAAAALTCSSHLHLPTRHLGRQAVICVCLLTVTHLSCSHMERIFICRACCLQRRLFMSDWIFIQQPLFLPHLPPNAGTVAGLKRVALVLLGNGEADVWMWWQHISVSVGYSKVCDINTKQISSNA